MPEPPPTPSDTPPAPDPKDAAAPTLRLDHFLKREVLVDTGGSAKQAIQSGMVAVNGQVETRRKRQLRSGDVVRFEGREVTVGAIEPRVALAKNQKP